MFKGSFVALITPFENGSIDETDFQNLVDWQIGEGTHGLVPCGTTGESPTLSHAEHERVIDLCVEAADHVRGLGRMRIGTPCDRPGDEDTDRDRASREHRFLPDNKRLAAHSRRLSRV